MSEDIFKKFSQNARHILIISQRIAKNMNSGIGTEHILMALTTSAGNICYDLLKDNAVNLDQVKMIMSLNNIRTNIHDGLSREAKEVLKIASKKAVDLKHQQIKTEHILWAMLSSREFRSFQIIQRIGVNPQEILVQLDEILTTSNPMLDKLIEKNLEMLRFGAANFPKEFDLMGKFKSNKISDSKTPYLDQYGIDLTKLAKEKKLDPVIGRITEINRTIQILSRRSKNNPVLVGEPGVGKTAIVEGLAQKIVDKCVPMGLFNKRIISLDLSQAIAGAMYRGQFEERLKKIIEETTSDKNIILFIDEIHMVVGAGSAEGSMDAANILKPSLSKGIVRLIGATTINEYRKYIEKDAALERRLQMVKVNEPTSEDTIKILQGIKMKYEEYHHIKISNEAISSAVELATRYISDRFLPDKAIDLIDEAAAAKQINSEFSGKNDKLSKLNSQLEDIIFKKEKSVASQNFQLAAQLKIEELQLKEKISQENKKTPSIKDEILHNDIAQVVSAWTSIPLENLIETEKKRFLKLEKILQTKIIGQDQAIAELSKAIRRAKSGIANPARPLGTFIFLGPTGVGKTELAKVLAHEVFSNPNALIKIDMSEFMEKHNISRLVGAPPGYVGFEEAGKLTEAVRRNPYCVIVFDEIEKAHPDVFNILLQILEDGYLTDAKGRRVNFRNSIIIMTSNIGVNLLNQQAEIGFQLKSKGKNSAFMADYEKMKKIVLEQLKKEFRPELLNRLDKIIVFKPLNIDSINKIVDLQLLELGQRIAHQKINIVIGKNVRQLIAKHGYDPKYGARPIRRLISDLLENQISDYILSGQATPQTILNINAKNEKIIIDKKRTPQINKRELSVKKI